MKTLNLVDLDKSDIKYKKIPFPDGQQNIVINPDTVAYDGLIIKSRLNNWLDLELIICAVASLRELGVEEIHLYTPYIMGARSDRKFEEGGNNYLKDVICPIINSLNFKTVTCIDPHSDVLEACIKGFRKIFNRILVEFALNLKPPLTTKEDYILVSPDAGASKKIYKLVEQIGYKGDIIACSKNRDIDGKIIGNIVPIRNEKGELYEHLKNKDFIIVDDICDGGATFINIAKPLKETFQRYNLNNKIYLIVTHGIFSKGFDELSQYFDGIYCTNSYQDLKDWSIDFGDISSSRQIKFVNEKIKQLNVF